jgi:hypothetical protein
MRVSRSCSLREFKRLSINEMCRLVLDDAGQAEPANVESRIWRPSLPVIHLAAATAVMMDTAERGGFPVAIGHLVLMREFIEAVVREAEQYETLLQNSRLRLKPGTLIECGCKTRFIFFLSS